MTQFLDIPSELDRLEHALETQLSPAMLETSRSVLDTLRIRPDREPRWTARLSPFVTLYPLLQSEAWSDQPTELVRRANEVHLFLLIYTFIDDRLVDGQNTLAPAEIVLAKQALLIALRIAREASLLVPETEAFWMESFEKYHRAQLRSYDSIEEEDAETRLEAQEQIVKDRAALGRLAVVSACHAAGHADMQSALGSAFDALAVGLQWEDDLNDWPHDLLASQQTLLLAGLDSGSIPREGDINDRLRSVDRCLVKSGTYSLAVERSLSFLEGAETVHSRFSCRQLVDATIHRRRSIEDLGRRLESAIAKEDAG